MLAVELVCGESAGWRSESARGELAPLEARFLTGLAESTPPETFACGTEPETGGVGDEGFPKNPKGKEKPLLGRLEAVSAEVSS